MPTVHRLVKLRRKIYAEPVPFGKIPRDPHGRRRRQQVIREIYRLEAMLVEQLHSVGDDLERSPRAGGLIRPCLPSPAKAPPSGPDWLHEIKHDGFRILARRDAAGVRLITRNGNDFTKRFPLVVAAVATLPVRSCLIDGEAIVSDDSGLAVFDLIRSWPTNLSAVLSAFDLL